MDPLDLHASRSPQIKREGFVRVSVFFKTVQVANRFMADPQVKERGLKPFIGFSVICRYGIIEGVSSNCTEERIIQTQTIKVTVVRNITIKGVSITILG